MLRPPRVGECKQRRRQRELNPAPPTLLDSLRLGHGSLAFGFLEPLLNASQVVRQPVGHRLGILRPVDRLGRKAFLGQGDELRIGAAAVEPRGGIGQIAVGRLAADFLARSTQIRRLAREDLAQDRAQAEDVGATVEVGDVAAGLLGRHVRRRAQDRAGLGVGAEAAVRAGAPRGANDRFLRLLMRPAGAFFIMNTPLGQHLGQPPVHHLDLAERPDHDVRRLEVAVNDSLGVGIRHRLRHLQSDAQQARTIGRWVGSLAENRRERLPFHQLHREERPVAEPADVVDRHHARVLKLPADLGLFNEPPGDVGPVGVFLQQHLHRQVTAQVDVATTQHGPHAAAGDLAVEAVPIAGLVLSEAWRRTWV